MFILIAEIIFVLNALLVPLYFYLTWHHSYWEKRGMITARPLTLLGTYPSVVLRNRNFIYDIQDVYDKYKEEHRAVGAFLTRQPQLLVLEPQLAHDILVKNFSHFRDSLTSSFVGHLKPNEDKYVRRSAFWSKGDYWKSQRMDAQGGLTQNKLKQAYAIWESSGKKLLKYIESQQDKVLETKDLSYRFTADVMSDFIWGIDAGTLSQPQEQQNTLQRTMSKYTTYAFNTFTLFFASIAAPFLRRLLKMRFFPKETDDFFSQLTKDSIEFRYKNPNVTRMDYLSYLLQLREQKGLSHDDIVGHTLTVLLDGYETSAGELVHIFYYLSEYPEAQQKLRDEINAATDFDADKSLNYDELNGLPYLEQCIYESLRLASLIPHFSKICTKVSTVELDGGRTQLRVEPGTLIMIPAYQIHYDERYFPEPNTFKPERFADGAHLEFMKKSILMPFGDGPRICIGKNLTLLTLKIALRHLISKYEIIRSEQKVELDTTGFGITLAGNIMLKFRKL